MIHKALINAGSSIIPPRVHSAYAAGFPWRPRRRMFIARLHRVPTLRDRFEYIQPTHLRRSAGRRCRLRRFESALDAQRLGNKGRIFETRSGNTPLDTRAGPYPRPLMALSRRFRYFAAARGHRSGFWSPSLQRSDCGLGCIWRAGLKRPARAPIRRVVNGRFA